MKEEQAQPKKFFIEFLLILAIVGSIGTLLLRIFDPQFAKDFVQNHYNLSYGVFLMICLSMAILSLKNILEDYNVGKIKLGAYYRLFIFLFGSIIIIGRLFFNWSI